MKKFGTKQVMPLLIIALCAIFIQNGLNKFGLSTAWQYVYMGGIIIVATTFDAWFRSVAAVRRKKRTDEDFAKMSEDTEGVKADG